MELIFLTINTQVNYFQAFNIFTIDNLKPLPMEVEVATTNSDDIHKFIQNIYNSFNHIKNRKSCELSHLDDDNDDNYPYVIGNLKKILEMKIDLDDNNEDEDENEIIFREVLKNHSQNIAAKLLNVQKTYISNNNSASKNPSDGSLIIIFTALENKPFTFNFVISKINLESYLDKEESKYRAGLPEKNSVQKSCFIEANYSPTDNAISFYNIVVADSNIKIADFWMNSFLELIPTNDDANNTSKAFGSFNTAIKRKIKSSPNDQIRLENNLIGYFENNQSFNAQEAVEAIVGQKPLKATLSITKEEFKDFLLELPIEKGFDTSFDIKEETIQNQFKKTISISESLDLRTKAHIEDLEDKIISREDREGSYELVIKDIDIETFEKFKRED